MAIDLYSSCPCGSGKKFKWCCQPVHEQLSRAFELDSKGQHDAALRLIDQVATEHPDNPEVWGRKAQMLFQMEKAEEAETALQKALDINPRYAYGYFLRGKFRQFEGEILGALSLFRKAVELYDPSATDILADIYAEIAEAENYLNHPLAAHAALQFVVRFNTTNPEIRQAMNQAFGEESSLPLAARREYTFMSLPATATAEQNESWKSALEKAATGKLSDAAAAFDALTKQNESLEAAWYNLTLCHAWAGNNAASLEALSRYVLLEPDEARAADAWTIGEVLRFGQGMEDQADCVRHMVTIPVQNRAPLVDFIRELAGQSRVANPHTDQENDLFAAMIMQKVQTLATTGPVRSAPKLAAQLVIVANMLRLFGVDRKALDELVNEFRTRLGPALGQPMAARGPANYAEVFSEALVFPIGYTDDAEAAKRLSDEFERYFEETWLNRPLKSLNQITPIDAAQHGQLRKKLRGVVQFIEQNTRLMQVPYDFARLRHKLGLDTAGPQAAPTAAVAAFAAARDFAAMNAPDLAALKAEELSDREAEQAYQAALKLDAREIAANFARALVTRPLDPERRDRYPWFNHLVQMAMADNDFVAAMNYVNDGESHDCEHNEGKRRNDFELRRAQVHVRSGEMDQAQEVFDRLIARDPADLKVRGNAAEAMLSARQGTRALRFAEAGLTQARQMQKRDSEEYFKELVSAAQKQA